MFFKSRTLTSSVEFKEELEDVEVIVKHEHRRGNKRVSFVGEVTVLVYGYRIELLKKAKVKVRKTCTLFAFALENIKERGISLW